MKKNTLFFIWLVLFLPIILWGGTKKICVTMIVKNDEAVIEKCLVRVQEIADYYCICDVGSTDQTISIIEKFFSARDIPGKIYQHHWRNFGYNRTFTADAAQNMLREMNIALDDTYLLILDPDMLISPKREFEKNVLQNDVYLILENLPLCCKYEARLLKASLPWECVGSVREYWSCGTSSPPLKLKTLSLKQENDDEKRAKKWENEIALLHQALKIEPNDPRYLFFLGQANQGLKKYEEAIRWYKERIETGKQQEEDWFARYMIGECYEELGKWDSALYWYLEAFQSKPDRGEPLLKVASHYRYIGENNLSYIFAKFGKNLHGSLDRTLFTSPPLSPYRFEEELSIAAYYTQYREEGFAAASDLVIRKNVPWHLREQTYKNLIFYVENIPEATFLPISIPLPLIREDQEERYHPMNPSIMRNEDGYTVICRSVNYTQTGAKVFNTIDPNGVFKTRNFLVQYDRDFNLLSQKEIVEDLSREKFRAWNLTGLEDCRLFSYGGETYFTCTTVDTNPTGEKQISVCKLDANAAGDKINVTSLTPLVGPDLYQCEKNWLPFIKDGKFCMVYSYDPFTLFAPDMETGECETILSYEPSCDFSRFRGSAAPIPFQGGYLLVVHEVTWRPNYERVYFHRFVLLDENFVVQKVSRPFTYNHLGVEYCCSMTQNHKGDQLIMTVGIEDREAYLCFVGFETVHKLLKPLPED